MAQGINQRATSEERQLRPYGVTGDRFQQKRYQFCLIYFVVPLALFGIVFYWLLIGRFQTGSSAVVTSVPPGASSGSPASSSLIGGTPAPGGLNLGGGLLSMTPAVAGPVARSSVGVTRIACFAKVDSKSVYSNTVVLANALFWAEKSTRVLGGMIYNDRFGWYRLEAFTCSGDLGTIEVEWFDPRPTATYTRGPTRYHSPVPTVVVIPSLVPTALPVGIVVFRVDGCVVQWQVNQVNAVFLNYGGVREGVAGEVNGGPVVRSICPYTGTVRIDVYRRDGTIDRREGIAR